VIRVLVVDDRPDVRLSFMYLLQACGYEAAEAGGGADALSYLSRKKVDVVLTDLDMPGMDGLELLETVRAGKTPPKVIVMTGSAVGDGEALTAAQKLGADAVLLKPLSRDQLQRTITMVLKLDRPERASGPHPYK
jgi:CheY-like chemotaxis protein